MEAEAEETEDNMKTEALEREKRAMNQVMKRMHLGKARERSLS